jgi:hypothetical protein
MTTKWLKGDAGLNAVVLIVAGTVGTVTGTAVEGLSLPAALAVAILVGLVVGAALYALIVAIKRRRAS